MLALNCGNFFKAAATTLMMKGVTEIFWVARKVFAQFFQFSDIGFVELGDMRDVLPGYRQMFGGFFADIAHGLTAHRSPFVKIRQCRRHDSSAVAGQWRCSGRC